MKTATTQVTKVRIVNVQTIGARCGFGTGQTLAEAQADALRIANIYYPTGNPRLSPDGWEVFVDGGINC